MQAKPKLIVLAAFDENDEGELLPAFEPREMQTEERATYMAKILSLKHKTVVAWSRDADPSKGEFGEARVLFPKGRIAGDGMMYAEEILSREPAFMTRMQERTPNTIGMVIRGYNMGAIKDGWFVFGERPTRPPHDGLVDELCLVKCVGDPVVYTRFLKKGRVPGRWDLLTVTGPAMLDVELEWATLIDWIKPHSLTKQEKAILEEGYYRLNPEL